MRHRVDAGRRTFKMLREPQLAAPAAGDRPGAAKMTLWQAFEERNVLISALMAVLLVSYLVVCWAFMPLYLTKVRRFDPQTMGAIFFVGWGLNGILPLVMATVPSESVGPDHTATVMGICMGTGEILGGVLSPSIAGCAADHSGLEAPLWMMFGLTAVAGLLALGLRETAPRVLARRRLAAGQVAAT